MQEESAPLADGGISQIEADAVRRVLKNVKFRRNAGFAQRQIERHAIFGRHNGVRGAAEEKGGRRLRSSLTSCGLGFSPMRFLREPWCVYSAVQFGQSRVPAFQWRTADKAPRGPEVTTG